MVELDPQTLAHLTSNDQHQLTEGIRPLLAADTGVLPGVEIRYEGYRAGSAFLNT